MKIVAEIISKDVKQFLEADKEKHSQIIEAFAKAGATAIVAEKLPNSFLANGWQKVGDTDYFAYLLLRSGGV